MSSYRQITALTVVSASLFYLWSRYCRKKKNSQSLSDQAFTHMAFASLLCCGTNPFRKRKKTKAKNKAPYKKKPSCSGLSVSAIDEGKQDLVVSVTSPEVYESVAPLDKPLIEANTFTDVLPDPLVHLDSVSEGAVFQEVAESCEIVEEEAFVSNSSCSVQIGPVVEAQGILEGSFLAAKDCTPIIELNDVTESNTTTLAKSIDKDSYEDHVVESPATAHVLEVSYSPLDSLKAEAEEAMSRCEDSALSGQSTQEDILHSTNAVVSQFVSAEPTDMECLNGIETEAPQAMLGVDAHDSIHPLGIVGIVCEASASDGSPTTANTEMRVMRHSDNFLQEVSGSTSAVQHSDESARITSPEFSATATETEEVQGAIDAHCVVGSTNVHDSTETISVAETCAVETAIPTSTALDAMGDSDSTQQEALKLVNSVSTGDLGGPVKGVQEAVTSFPPDSHGLQIMLSSTDSGVQQEASGYAPLESICVQANSVSLMASSDVASGVAESVEALNEAGTTLSTSIDAASPKSGSCESVVVTSDSDQAHLAPEDVTEAGDKYQIPQVPKGIFNDPEHDIVEAPPEDFDGTLIPRVLVPSDLLARAVDEKIWVESINVPACMGGVLIGRFGKNVRELRTDLKAEMTLSMNPGCQNSLLLKISCPLENKDSVNEWVNKRLNTKPSQTTIGNPNQLQRLLPLGQVTDVMVRSLYGQKEFFVTIQDTEYIRYREMQEELDKDYYSLSTPRMQLYEPVTSGTVAVLSHRLGFARVVILKVLVKWPRLALCFMLDHGTFAIAPITDLRKIKTKYMRVPFQAIHVSWAHALPVYTDAPVLHILRTFFERRKLSAFPVRMETCCRSSVVFLERSSISSPNAQPAYRDILFDACQNYFFQLAPVVISPSRQMWINRTDTPYYYCPYSAIPYDQFVHYLPEVDVQQPQQEQVQMQQQQPQHRHQQQQRGGPNHTHNRTRRFGNNSGGGGGAYKRTQNLHTNHQNGRRSRRNGPINSNGQQHQQRAKKKESNETTAVAKT
ncbi:unnamed protein product [Hydatigera taeniaeformis]|uniref:Tudor domain-containing protein n=1 Tax=Hydatigena taeniaeformis TaxID=6205 RepID=A0A0R3WNB6_HYDTA|nr:unnamed protein product [Hydatigera taeniaeformis]